MTSQEGEWLPGEFFLFVSLEAAFRVDTLTEVSNGGEANLNEGVILNLEVIRLNEGNPDGER